MEQFESLLRNEWLILMKSFGVPDAQANAALERMREKYLEPHRAYHTWKHVWDVMNELYAVETTLVHPRETKLGVFYHDVIYNPRSTTNEADSADFLESELVACGVPHPSIAVARERVMATLHIGGLTLYDNQVIADADIASLGYSWEKFETGSRAIRFEYQHVPEEDFRKGRHTVMQRFLDRDPIYYTRHFRTQYERQAKANLARTVAELA